MRHSVYATHIRCGLIITRLHARQSLAVAAAVVSRAHLYTCGSSELQYEEEDDVGTYSDRAYPWRRLLRQRRDHHSDSWRRPVPTWSRAGRRDRPDSAAGSATWRCPAAASSLQYTQVSTHWTARRQMPAEILSTAL